MADHFYSVANPAVTKRRQRSDIVVGTAATGANPIELRITDGSLTAQQVYDFCEFIADLFSVRDFQVIPAGTVR